MSLPLAILSTGLVTSVGLSAAAACAAIRAGVTNPTETRFVDSAGARIVAHEVPLADPVRGRAKLARMAAMAIDECLATTPRERRPEIPLLLAVAEPERPGRHAGLDDELIVEIEEELGFAFSSLSATIPYGRVGIAVAMARARRLLAERAAPFVVIAATDSLLTSGTLSAYAQDQRLLTEENSNGFMPGEGAGALLVGEPTGQPELICCGIGLGVEQANLESGLPLRADGLVAAMKEAFADAGSAMNQMDFRITDLSGEHYYFKEAALALSRTLRARKQNFELWHPAEATGEQGAAAGLTLVALADAACKKNFAIGPNILGHLGTDSGRRSAIVLMFRGSR